MLTKTQIAEKIEDFLSYANADVGANDDFIDGYTIGVFQMLTLSGIEFNPNLSLPKLAESLRVVGIVY